MSDNSHLLHAHRRKQFRLSKKKEKQLIDRVCSVFAVLMPLTTIPQIYVLYSTQDSTGISLLMWLLHSIGVVPFLMFGIINKHQQLITLNVLWLFVNIIMITGILLYR